jgi:hypothetical protein
MIDKPTERSVGPVRFATFNLRICSPVRKCSRWPAGAPILRAFADFNALI